VSDENVSDLATRATARAAAESLATVRLSSLTGGEEVEQPDPTEDYHEASRLYRGSLDPRVTGGQRLISSLELRVSATRSVKRYRQLPTVPLPPAELGIGTLADALARRRSSRAFGAYPVSWRDLASLLYAAYGVTASPEGTPQRFRTAPSGGALYPLELYVLARRVDGLDPGMYHFDPLEHALESLPSGTSPVGASLTPYGDLLESSALTVAITAMFWRSRFKYGARAYRFTLLEAGHVAQNLLLAATSLGLAALPLGGFYDRDVDAQLGIDGIHEASLYLIPVGPDAE
jgi:SagB-type dehydrogenase family enzyme